MFYMWWCNASYAVAEICLPQTGWFYIHHNTSHFNHSTSAHHICVTRDFIFSPSGKCPSSIAGESIISLSSNLQRINVLLDLIITSFFPAIHIVYIQHFLLFLPLL